MNFKLSSQVYLRPWTEQDAEFSLKVRNHPELMKWFRQDEPLKLDEQIAFIKQDVSPYGEYNGQVIVVDGERAGLCGVKNTGEFTIGVLPEFQHKGISKKAMELLIETYASEQFPIWSEVFVGNPALEWFIRLGFRVTDVHERAYYKKGRGLIDTVEILHD